MHRDILDAHGCSTMCWSEPGERRDQQARPEEWQELDVSRDRQFDAEPLLFRWKPYARREGLRRSMGIG